MTNMMKNCYAVILAGGRGERFWPMSTAARPKQLLALTGDKPLIRLAVERLEGLLPVENILIVTNADLVEATRDAAPELPADNVFGEPMGRDTAAAVALSAALVHKRDPQAAFCILTADHIIRDLDIFHQTLRGAFELALAQDCLITIGIEPREPSTSFGYIEACSQVAEQQGVSFLKADRFREKPDRETARQYITSGNFYWNSGMFIWSVPSLRNGFAKHEPRLNQLMDDLEAALESDAPQEAVRRIFEPIEKISIDYALMEKADNILMARGGFYWDDVGSWPALRNHFEDDENNNVLVGNCEAIDARLNVVYSKDRLTALIGVQGLVVVQAEGVTLICAEDQAEDIKKMVRKLRESGNYDDVL